MEHISQTMTEHAKSYPQRKEAKESQRLKAIGNRLLEGTPDTPQSQADFNSSVEPKGDEAMGDGPSERTASQERNRRIDGIIDELTRRGWIPAAYRPFHFRAIHTLGIQAYNQLAISAASGNNPAHLFAYKVKGAMLEHKRTLQQQEY